MKSRNSTLPAALILPASDLAADDIEGSEQGRGPVPLVVVRLADHRPAVGQFVVRLGTFQRLDRRLLIDRKTTAFGRVHVKANDVRRLRYKLRVRALAPGLAAGEVDLLPPQEPPDILFVDVHQLSRQQRRGPVGVAVGRRSPQLGYVAGPIRPADLHYVYASHPAGHACLDQSQYPTHRRPQVNIS